jgi:hypothetical protein
MAGLDPRLCGFSHRDMSHAIVAGFAEPARIEPERAPNLISPFIRWRLFSARRMRFCQ